MDPTSILFLRAQPCKPHVKMRPNVQAQATLFRTMIPKRRVNGAIPSSCTPVAMIKAQATLDTMAAMMK